MRERRRGGGEGRRGKEKKSPTGAATLGRTGGCP
jgi:hypothetical protein